ncbi:endonuclease/exonuclease/phosphatase family protein [Marinomonas pollencensis]|uniref:Endonuclease/exonuclease/phosphatase (EEP) superfamily protein YafD n=1 Tax=Marinomonas pollencensis TaxID=491954 RepID=A0A3E0DSG3_9GAMM|nr:endonuclease/exonuclease/phosphatase family protein [Marinomonas pollencensis]REG84348.1 endonuclease/exonuclease/phosphatase (EEP) superfamily protein YafD [Marinomonas pollencensis]
MITQRYRSVESLTLMGNAPKQALGPNIELLLWNVFKCKRKGWQKDFSSLIHNKDLILLQEAVLNTPFDNLFHHSLQHQWIMASSFRNLKSNIETGVKTGASVAAQSQYFSASEHGEPLTQTKKMLLAIEYPLVDIGSTTASSLLVINAHLINFVAIGKFRAHLEQISHTLQGHNGPIVLAGDFNTWNKKRLASFNKLAAEYSLQQVDMVRQPRLNHLFRHLDHVYCRGFEVTHVQVHSDIHSSDHYPISLSLQLTK